MTIRSPRLAMIACGCSVLLASNGCQRPQAPVIPATPQQRQAEIDGNSHIPAAQKAAIKARIANTPPVKVQPTPSLDR